MSGRKSNLKTYQALSAQSMAASFTSPVTSVINQDNIAIQLNCTGSPEGSFVVEVSSDYSNDQASSGSPVINAGTWVALTLTGSPVLVGSPDQIFIDLNQIPAPFIRVRYIRTAGSGACDMYITTKML
jgi:hypothetical protein